MRHMLLTKRELPVLIVNVIYVSIFLIVALREFNFKFVLYIGVVLAVGGLIVWRQATIQFDLPILWGLTIWGIMHLAGGNIHVGDSVLYNVVLLPIVSAPFHVVRYDQVVHTFGFGVAALVCYHLLKPYLRDGITRWRTVGILVVLMGSGLGAVNEIIEFFAEVAVPETNVGGYYNTAIDLVCNFIGGILAVVLIASRRRAAAM